MWENVRGPALAIQSLTQLMSSWQYIQAQGSKMNCGATCWQHQEKATISDFSCFKRKCSFSLDQRGMKSETRRIYRQCLYISSNFLLETYNRHPTVIPKLKLQDRWPFRQLKSPCWLSFPPAQLFLSQNLSIFLAQYEHKSSLPGMVPVYACLLSILTSVLEKVPGWTTNYMITVCFLFPPQILLIFPLQHLVIHSFISNPHPSELH